MSWLVLWHLLPYGDRRRYFTVWVGTAFCSLRVLPLGNQVGGRQAVERVRKLPNTLVRRDADVRRMTDYQELELVVRGGGRPETAGGRQPAPFSAPIVY